MLDMLEDYYGANLDEIIPIVASKEEQVALEAEIRAFGKHGPENTPALLLSLLDRQGRVDIAGMSS